MHLLKKNNYLSIEARRKQVSGMGAV